MKPTRRLILASAIMFVASCGSDESNGTSSTSPDGMCYVKHGSSNDDDEACHGCSMSNCANDCRQFISVQSDWLAWASCVDPCDDACRQPCNDASTECFDACNTSANTCHSDCHDSECSEACSEAFGTCNDDCIGQLHACDDACDALARPCEDQCAAGKSTVLAIYESLRECQADHCKALCDW